MPPAGAQSDDPDDWQTSRPHWPAWLAQARTMSAALWRGVEARHRVATLEVVDTLAEQELLEELLEEGKPPLPPGSGAIHYLLVTPFRYVSPWPSRFRSPHEAGVWYGAHELRTACAEVGYWRWRFAVDSDAFRDDAIISELTFFVAHVRGHCADLAVAPWAAFEAAWMQPFDYSACRALAHAARQAEIDWIHYRSVRDPVHGACGAVLRPSVLQIRDITRQQTWTCLTRRGTVVMKPTTLGSTESPMEFDFASAPDGTAR